MARICHAIFIILNVLTSIFGLVCITGSIYFYVEKGMDCQQVLQAPLLISGLLTFLVSTMGILASCFRINSLLVLYIVLMFFVILLHVAFTLFLVFVANRNAGIVAIRLGFKKQFVHDINRRWLKRYFLSEKRWSGIRNCLANSGVCGDQDKIAVSHALHFLKGKLSPLLVGCCKPPRFCGFKQKNRTFWEMPRSGPAVPHSDCSTWGNKQDKLCFDCSSCKVGAVADIISKWRSLANSFFIFILVAFVILIITTASRRNIMSKRKIGSRA